MIRDVQFEGFLLGVVTRSELDRPRNSQVELGISDLGGCREYIRATVAGDEGRQSDRVRGLDGAIIGTVVGDALEQILGRYADAETQVPVTVRFPKLGIEVAGHADAMVPKDDGSNIEWSVLDFKSVHGLEETLKEGPSLKNLIQVSCYAIGLDLKSASLVYYDRSGSDRKFLVYTLDEDDIETYYELAESRLRDVFEVIDAGSPEESRWSLRDQEPGTCAFFGCPFLLNCWGGSEWIPSTTISTEDGIARVASYLVAREEAKRADAHKKAARFALTGIEGVTSDGEWAVSWKETRYRDQNGDPVMRLDVIPVNRKD